MTTLLVLLLLLAAVCFIAATFGVSANRINLFALGLFFWVLVPLIQLGSKL